MYTNWWIIVYMMYYTDVQKNMIKELQKLSYEDYPTISYAERKRIPYTTAVVHEVMRHASPNPVIKRKAMEDFVIENKYFIEKGTYIVGNLYGLSHDENHWQDCYNFNPDRFLLPSGELNESVLNNFLPFGIGARRCIAEGIGIKYAIVITANLFRKFYFYEANDAVNINCTYGMSLTPTYEMAKFKINKNN
ncbi:hypothetical protein A3Q56_05651 [Intoshia linei]|uniref:Cytochrome P450 n=1 Tax=Intoshia linei TaxID=1819745 RepID=A0A177AXC7_9BILA|nr:hypothetical protein A3Q56_05651 [Intoshia linei]